MSMNSLGQTQPSVQEIKPVKGLVSSYEKTEAQNEVINKEVSDKIDDSTRGNREENKELIDKLCKELGVELKTDDKNGVSFVDGIVNPNALLDSSNKKGGAEQKKELEKEKYDIGQDISSWGNKAIACQKIIDNANNILNLSSEEFKNQYPGLTEEIRNEYVSKIIEFYQKEKKKSERIVEELEKVKKSFEKKEKEDNSKKE